MEVRGVYKVDTSSQMLITPTDKIQHQPHIFSYFLRSAVCDDDGPMELFIVGFI